MFSINSAKSNDTYYILTILIGMCFLYLAYNKKSDHNQCRTESAKRENQNIKNIMEKQEKLLVELQNKIDRKIVDKLRKHKIKNNFIK